MKSPLDLDFCPIVRQPGSQPLVIGLEREGGRLSRFETTVAPDALRYVERLVKFLLWARGGWRLYLSGPRALCERVRVPDFDRELMGRVYERQFEIVVTDTVPPAKELAGPIGGHLNGCRLGFDLGASDFKIAAVKNGEVLYSDEFPWNPKDQPEPEYHFDRLNAGLKKAAGFLPRVDAIGGSTAGVVVDNKIMVASLFRSVPAEKFADAKNIFLRLRDEWRVPLEVANDGDVTALAGALSLGVTGVLGVAMGSSEAAGYIDRQGRMTGWLNELAFAPVDDNPAAPADEWSGDRGVGALYFSQQAVNKLLPAAGISLAETGLPERLKAVQALMAQGDARAAKIYETIGVYLGYAIPHYREFYDFDHLLVLGRVMTGRGGDLILNTARNVLGSSQIQIHVPDEKTKRVGQAVAAASLPAL
ncbi:MAG: ROK family protein [Verrucomicrobiota bacterium]